MSIWVVISGYDGPVPSLAYVVAIKKDAWPSALLREKGAIWHNDLILRWQAGMTSASDKVTVRSGWDIGHATVTDKKGNPVVSNTHFAFVFSAFTQGGVTHTDE